MNTSTVKQPWEIAGRGYLGCAFCAYSRGLHETQVKILEPGGPVGRIRIK